MTTLETCDLNRETVCLYPRREKISLYPRRKIVLRPRLRRLYPRPELEASQYRPIVKKEMTKEDWDENWLEWIATVPGFVDAFTRDMEGKPTTLYDYQIEHMLDPSPFKHRDKSRQVGYSYVLSAEATAKTHLKRLHTTIFISMNQEEANEKIRYAQSLYDALPSEFKRKLVIQNKQSLEFQSGSVTNRILSFAQRQPRGKGQETDIVLDEFAHMRDGAVIYTASVPVISRGKGSLTLNSTPLGKANMHYIIGHDVKNYPMFSHMIVPWWWCPVFIRPELDLADVRSRAEDMSTEDRVRAFGSLRLRSIFSSMSILEFKQEYEIFYIDSSISFLPLDLIRACVFTDTEDIEELEGNIDPEEVPESWAAFKDEEGKEIRPDTIMERYREQKKDIFWHGVALDIDFEETDGFQEQIRSIVDELKLNAYANNWGRHLYLGYDVGRERDGAELVLIEEIDFGDYNLHITRLVLGLYDVPYYLQEETVKLFIKNLRVDGGLIDSTGAGSQLGESINREYPFIEPVKFSNERKGLWARRFKQRLEDRTLALIDNKRLITQIHSIRRIVGETSVIKYEAEKNRKEKHHGDKFWALALASAAGHFYERNLNIHRDEYKVGESRIISDVRPVSVLNGPQFENGDGMMLTVPGLPNGGRLDGLLPPMPQAPSLQSLGGLWGDNLPGLGSRALGGILSEFMDFRYRG